MYPGSTSPGLLINVILCFEAKPDRGKTNPAHWLGKFKAIPVLISSTSFEELKHLQKNLCHTLYQNHVFEMVQMHYY